MNNVGADIYSISDWMYLKWSRITGNSIFQLLYRIWCRLDSWVEKVRIPLQSPTFVSNLTMAYRCGLKRKYATTFKSYIERQMLKCWVSIHVLYTRASVVYQPSSSSVLIIMDSICRRITPDTTNLIRILAFVISLPMM